MDRDTVLKDLRRIRRLNADIDVLARTIRRLKDQIAFYKQFNRASNAVEHDLWHFEKIYTASMEKCIDAEKRYVEPIADLPPLYRAVVIDAYVNGRRIEDIAAANHYSAPGVKKILAKAVDLICENWQNYCQK